MNRIEQWNLKCQPKVDSTHKKVDVLFEFNDPISYYTRQNNQNIENKSQLII